MSNPAAIASKLLLAARCACGDFRATKSALARWCTEELRATAGYLSVPSKFAAPLPVWREATREECLFLLCGWASWQRVEEWGHAYRAARAAAAAAMPEALAELGAAI